MNNTAVIYPRFSSYGQNEQSIESQIRICKEFAESKGLRVINVYPEKSKSGTTDSRPAFQRMIADAKSGAFKYIIVYMFDRFARNRRDSIMYKEMLKEKYGIKVLSALEPIAEDEGGEFYEMFLDWNAENYSKRLSKRVKDGLDTSVENGTYCGGTLIYGYKIELEPIAGKPNKSVKKVAIDEETSQAVKYAFEQYSKGITKKEIAEQLNKDGYRFHGKLFKGRSLDKILVNRKYTGDFYFGERRCTNMYPPLISVELYEVVQKRLNENRYSLGGEQSSKIPYLLTGKVFCGHCGTPMVSDGGTSKSGIQHHYYACKKMKKRQCTKKRENKDNLEQYVTDCVIDFLSDKNNVEIIVADVLDYYEKRTDENNLKSIVAKINKIKSEVNDLTDAFVKAKSSLLQNSIETKMQEYEIMLEDLEYQRARLELERGCRLTKKDLIDFVEEILKGDKNDKEYQKKIIDHLVNKVFVCDDNTVVIFNVKGGNDLKELDYIDVENIVKDTKSVQAQSPLARQKRKTVVYLSFFVFDECEFGQRTFGSASPS